MKMARGLKNKKMKKFLSILLLTLSLTTMAQVAPPGFTTNNSSTAFRMLSGFGLFGLPQDTFTIPTADKGLRWIANKGDSTYLWSVLQQKWIIMVGGGGPSTLSTLTISSPLTGGSYDGSAPVSIGLDTNIIHTSAFNEGRYLTGNTIFTGNGSLSGDRTVDLNGHFLNFVDGDNQITIDPVSFTAALVVSNGTRFTNLSIGAGSTAVFNLETGNGVHNVLINGDADDDLMVYTAGRQTFNITNELKIHSSIGDVEVSPDEGYLLLANDGTNDLLTIDQANHFSLIRANNTADGSLSGLIAGADSGGDGVYFNLSAFASSTTTNIYGDGVAKSISYTADSHTFTGNVIVSNLATGGSAPSTTGTTKMVITDDNGLLSFADTPSNIFNELSADFHIQNDSLKNTNWVNVKDFGAVGNGVAEDTAAIRAAIATGKDVFIPEGVFLSSATGANTTIYTLNPGQKIFGLNRKKSIIKTTSNARIIAIEPGCEVNDLGFLGDNSKASSADQYQCGVFISTDDTLWSINNCYFKNFGGNDNTNGGAIRAGSINTTNSIGGSISNVQMDNCYYGITLLSRAEYINFNNIKIDQSHVGIYDAAGNNPKTDVTIQQCDTALIQFGGTNNGHSVTGNSNFNHNTVNLVVDGITNGQLYNGVMLYAGDVIIRNSKGVRFSNCDFSTGTVTLTADTGLYRSGRYVTMSTNVVSGESFNVFGETRTNTTPITAIKIVNGDAIESNGTITTLDDAYDASTWNGNSQVPTKNAVRDKIESLSGGFTNPMTTLGDIIYEDASPAAARLAGNTTTTKKFLRQTGNGTISAVPAWDVLVAGDIPNLSGTYQPLDADLTSLAANSTNGVLAHTAANTITARTITGTSNEVTVTNGDGVSGNPTISLPSTLSLGGKSMTVQDNNWTMQDNSDNTKKIAFELASIATGTTRTITWPDASITVARSDAAQSFTGIQTFLSALVLNTGTLTANSVTHTFPSVAGTVVEYSTASITTSATPSPAGDARMNNYYVTAAANGTLTFAAPSGTPTNGNILTIRIKDNGTSRTLAWNAIYRASPDLPLPGTTVISKTIYVQFLYNSADATWDLITNVGNY